uniref:Uncharacterized protein n=1 Tax=Rhizophora mucronata TaxID=61149 RepID=A0A2P2QB50_RHIMU
MFKFKVAFSFFTFYFLSLSNDS